MSASTSTPLLANPRGPQSPLDSREPLGQSSKFRPMTFPRKRAVTACETCRLKKTKCDNQRPRCASCLKHDAPCSYDHRLDHSSFDPASLLILEKLDQALQKLESIGLTGSAPSAAAASSQPRKHSAESDDASILCSADCLEVPTAFSSTDCILSWPIFAGRWSQDFLSQEIFTGNVPSPRVDSDESGRWTKRSRPGVNEEDVPLLVERFLQLVHPKNPVLEARQLRAAGRKVAEDGVSWDDTSCVVLLTCALGAVARPFDPSYEGGCLHGRSSLQDSADVRDAAEAYYQLARRRIGLLDPSITAAQCHMLSGIYLMYTLHPHQGWLAFHQAGSVYSLYLKSQAALQERSGRPPSASMQSQRRIEQRLYWTILKSECEVRVQLDLAQSDLCKLGYPYLFPSPPTPRSPAQSPHEIFTGQTPASTSTTAPSQMFSLNSSTVSQKAEEQSWFYYLSEIAVRRIENRMLTAFYKGDHNSWSQMSLASMISAAEDIEAQLETWQSSLPDVIRFENLGPDDTLDELRYVTQGRVLCIRIMLYRPFLYYAIHCRHQVEDNSNDMTYRLQNFVTKCLNTCLAMNAGHAMTHRHHGTWYGLRENVASSITLLAAEMGGLITISDSQESSPDFGGVQGKQYGHVIRLCIEKLRYWEAEAPRDIARARELLEQVTASIC